MTEELFHATLDGIIPLQEVLTWISNGTCGLLLQEKLKCNRENFILFLLNFLHQSTTRTWHQSSTNQSLLKPVCKISKFGSTNRCSGQKCARRIELFPTLDSLSPQRFKQQGKEDTDIEVAKEVPAIKSPLCHSLCEALGGTSDGVSERANLKDLDSPFYSQEQGCQASSSSFSPSSLSDAFPQLTPISKRVSVFKSNEKSSLTPDHSPDHQYKTPTRGNGLCLGDFLTKGNKTQSAKKRFSQSPTTNTTSNSTSSPNNIPVPNDKAQSNSKRHGRRINPTKVSVGNALSSPQNFQRSALIGSASCSLSEDSPFQASISVEPLRASQSFSEERNLLKQERLKLQSQGDNASMPVVMVTSLKPVGQKMSVTADPEKVTFTDQLLKISDMYCCTLDANLVPNLMSELYFIFSMLVVQMDSDSEETVDILQQDDGCEEDINKKLETDGIFQKGGGYERDTVKKADAVETCIKERELAIKRKSSDQFFQSVHNCVFFATCVLSKQILLLSNLDRPTLKLLVDCERISVFTPTLMDRLSSLYTSTVSSKLKVSEGPASSNAVSSANVSFQSDTDNSSNFPSAQCFSNFRKQRDGFYELLRIWEAGHLKQGWCFATTLGSRVRMLLHLCNDPVNLMHFARLFRLQLVSSVRGGPNNSDEGSEDVHFLKDLKGVDPEKLHRLRDRLVTSYKAMGPRPAPSFHGPQEFYRDFIIFSSHSSFMQHLQNSLISHLLELDKTSFLASDTEDSDVSVDGDTRQNYLSCVLTMRLIAKFLGLIVFLPYSRSEATLPENIVEADISVRAKVVPPVNILQCLIDAFKTHRLVVTVPWVVKFLGMMDFVSCALPVYQSVLQFLLHLYLALHQKNSSVFGSKLLPSKTVLLLRLSLGWLFEAPFIQDSFFYTSCFSDGSPSLLTSLCSGDKLMTDDSTSGLDSSDLFISLLNFVPPVDALNLVDCEVLYAVCPFLYELKALLSSKSSESAPSGNVRHITPVSAGSSVLPHHSCGKQLQLKLEDSFFHGLPASVHRSVEFVVERVTSSCVKHICNVWLPGLKQNGLNKLQVKIQIIRSESDSESNSSVIQIKLKNEIRSIVDSVSQELKSKCHSGVGDFCLSKCRGALMSLLPEDSLSLPVCEMCVNIASRMSEERVITWMQNHATLTLYSKELQSEVDKALKNRGRLETMVSAKTSHIAPGANASWKHDDSTPSPFCVLQALKLMVSNVLSGEDIARENIMDILDKIKQSVTKRHDVAPAAERVLALLTVDLAVSLVCHKPYMVDSALQSQFIILWKLDALRPVEDGLSRLVCPRNMLLLAQSNHPARLVWEKLADVVAAVLKENLVLADVLENQCLAIMQQEWPQNILRCFAMCMNEVVRQYQKQKNVDYKFVLLLEWLAETMAQTD